MIIVLDNIIKKYITILVNLNNHIYTKLCYCVTKKNVYYVLIIIL